MVKFAGIRASQQRLVIRITGLLMHTTFVGGSISWCNCKHLALLSNGNLLWMPKH